MKKKRLFFLLVVLWVAAGFVPWQVGIACRWIAQRVRTQIGWEMTFANARWIPWQDLELADVKLKAPTGGIIHFPQVRVAPLLWSLYKGSLTTRWTFGEIRIDPGSWKIRQPLALEILSAGPVTRRGRAVTESQWGRLVLRELTLKGQLVQLRASGNFTQQRDVDLTLQGTLSRILLEEMNLMKPGEGSASAWESFIVRLHGPSKRPEVSLTSNFLTLSFKMRGEKT